MARLWEYNEKPSVTENQYYSAIVLGGLAFYDQEKDNVVFKSGSDRLMQAITLYKKGMVKKIIFSGGSGYLNDTIQTEAIFIRDYLLNIGIPKKDILIDSTSKNTRENAQNTYELLQKEKVLTKSHLLVTSASHMKRAKGCFNKVEIDITPYPTDRLAVKREYGISSFISPSLNALQTWTLILHELLGYATYKTIGYL